MRLWQRMASTKPTHRVSQMCVEHSTCTPHAPSCPAAFRHTLAHYAQTSQNCPSKCALHAAAMTGPLKNHKSGACGGCHHVCTVLHARGLWAGQGHDHRRLRTRQATNCMLATLNTAHDKSIILHVTGQVDPHVLSIPLVQLIMQR
jgi:hypothetical protein